LFTAGIEGPISDAFGGAAEDLAEAFSKINPDELNRIFKNGRVFANMEIIYPATKNVISYNVAVLQFHNLVEYDDKANVVETDMTGGATLQRIIQDANAHLQKTFSFIPPQKIKLGRVYDFEDQQSAFFNEINQLRQRYNLKETDRVTEYHKAWWNDIIQTKAKELGYDIPENILTALIYRWAFNDKSTNISVLKKEITNPDFEAWVTEFDKKDFKVYQKQNMEPFETIFLRLGAVVLKNAENFLAANPTESVQELKADLAQLIKELQVSEDPSTIKKLEHELRRIQRLGGFEAIIPSEGIVFVFGGHTYKLTGAFAPVNQLLGVLKYAR
jgi:type III secretory pathway component EscV